MLKKIIAAVISCSCLYSFSAEEAAPSFSTYKGKHLMPETLPLLAPQLPKEDLQAIRAWMNDPLRNRIIRELSRLPWPLAGITGNFGQQIEGIRQMLQFQGMPNLSSWNYVFKIGDTKYFMYIAGILNRVCNLKSLNGVSVSTPDVMCDKMLVKQGPTYQNVSRLALYLRAKEAREKFNLDKIEIPATYLIGLDKDKPDKVEDDNSVIVQEGYGSQVKSLADFVINKITSGRLNLDRELRLKETLVNKISPEAVRQLAIMCAYAPIFDASYNNVKIDEATGQFVFSDFEQPNGSNPNDFFNKNEKYLLDVSIAQGIGGINKIFGFNKYPHLQPICDKLMELKGDACVWKKLGSGQLPDSIAGRLPESPK